MIGPRSHALCFVCGRQCSGFGYVPAPNHPIGWLCEECWPVAKKAYHMPDEPMNAFEAQAILAGGERAGAYLDSLGRTDLAQLQPEEWEFFLAEILLGYGDAMRAQLTTGQTKSAGQ